MKREKDFPIDFMIMKMTLNHGVMWQITLGTKGSDRKDFFHFFSRLRRSPSFSIRVAHAPQNFETPILGAN